MSAMSSSKLKSKFTVVLELGHRLLGWSLISYGVVRVFQIDIGCRPIRIFYDAQLLRGDKREDLSALSVKIAFSCLWRSDLEHPVNQALLSFVHKACHCDAQLFAPGVAFF